MKSVLRVPDFQSASLKSARLTLTPVRVGVELMALALFLVQCKFSFQVRREEIEFIS